MYDIKLAKQLALGEPYRLSGFDAFDRLAYPIWKRIKIKDTTPPEFKAFNNQKILFHRTEGLAVNPLPLQTEAHEALVKDIAYGPSEKHKRLTEIFANAGSRIEVADHVSIEEPIVVRLELNENNPILLDRHTLTVGKEASVTVVYDYSGQGKEVYHCGLLNVIAAEGAKVHVVKLQNLSETGTHIHGGLALVGRDASVTYNSVDLGSALTVTDFSTYLREDNGLLKINSIYLGEGKEKMDLGYNTYHHGRRTESDVTVKGALLDESRKVFRGNLFFAKGAGRAHGSEQEYVILLDEGVKADAIPALMCDEDDVQGEHAASAGQVDANQLFYLMSRGFSEKEAKELIIMAAFAPVIESLPVEGLRERIHETVGRKLAADL